MKKNRFKFILAAILLFLACAAVSPAYAQDGVTCEDKWRLGCPLIPTECTDDDVAKTPCTFNHAVETLIHIANWLVAVIGGVVFGYFVYGGFILLTAAGNSSQVEHGKRVLMGTIIGLIIVLGAFLLVSWVGTLFSGGGSPAGFNQFLESGPPQCINVGDPCTVNGQRVYACGRDGTCSGQSLCEYWAGNGGGIYDVPDTAECTNKVNCNGNHIPNLCPGDSSVVCCIPN